MKTFCYVALFSLALNQTVMADDKDIAEELLRNKLDAVISVLQEKDLAQQAKNDEIMKIVTPIFDFSLMAKLSLGKKYWQSLTNEEKERFSELFVKRLKDSYLEKLNLYSDEKIVYGEPVEAKKKIHITTELISKNNKISMSYKLYKSKNCFQIYDIEIEGVSLIRTYRSQFDQVLRKGTIDELLLKLEQPIDS